MKKFQIKFVETGSNGAWIERVVEGESAFSAMWKFVEEVWGDGCYFFRETQSSDGSSQSGQVFKRCKTGGYDAKTAYSWATITEIKDSE